MSIDFTFRDGFYHAPERIDELTETPDLSSATEPLKLDMSYLRSINSYGIRNMIKMVRDWGNRKLEFHACPPVFIDSVNVVRSMIGTPPVPSRIFSFAIPHYCAANDKTYDLMFETQQIKISNTDYTLPDVECAECDGDLEVDCNLEEYLLFLSE